MGVQYEYFSITWTDVLASVLAATLAELAFSNVLSRSGVPRRLFFPESALAAAFGIGIFLRGTSPWVFACAAFLAVASKYLIRIKGRHIFNPSNFGIVSLVYFVPFAATIEFTQWGVSRPLIIVVSCIALVIAYRAGVIVTTGSFLISYTVLLLLFVGLDPFYFAVHHLGLLSPSIILFASFMITDPRTSPASFWGRILHGCTVAALYFVLE